MEQFTEGIKKWVMLEKKITNIKEEYNLKLKDYKDKKDNLENELTKFMKENELTDSIIKLPDGKIKYNETNISQPITYKFLKEIFTSDADMIPDYENKKLIIRLHSLSTPRANQAVKELCSFLNKTETCFPFTNLTLIYETVAL